MDNNRKVEEVTNTALETLEEIITSARTYEMRLGAIQVALNYDIQLRILETEGKNEKQPTPWPTLGSPMPSRR